MFKHFAFNFSLIIVGVTVSNYFCHTVKMNYLFIVTKLIDEVAKVIFWKNINQCVKVSFCVTSWLFSGGTTGSLARLPSRVLDTFAMRQTRQRVSYYTPANIKNKLLKINGCIK